MTPVCDQLLTSFDVRTTQSVVVAAPQSVVYDAARDLDLSSSRLVRALFALRGLPLSALTADGLRRLRFTPLLEDRPNAFALGIIGRFWTPGGALQQFSPEDFGSFGQPGFAKAVWAFEVVPLSDDSTRLTTETRVLAMDAPSRRRFRLYWSLVGPFSKIIRRVVLDCVRTTAERNWTRQP